MWREGCRQNCLYAPDGGRRKLAATPWLFRETNNPKNFVVVPAYFFRVSEIYPYGLFRWWYYRDKCYSNHSRCFVIPLRGSDIISSQRMDAWRGRKIGNALQIFSRDCGIITFLGPRQHRKTKNGFRNLHRKYWMLARKIRMLHWPICTIRILCPSLCTGHTWRMIKPY